MMDKAKIEANVVMLEELFKTSDADILKSNTRKQLEEIYTKVYEFPCRSPRKADILYHLHHWYGSIKRAEALSCRSASVWRREE